MSVTTKLRTQIALAYRVDVLTTGSSGTNPLSFKFGKTPVPEWSLPIVDDGTAAAFSCTRHFYYSYTLAKDATTTLDLSGAVTLEDGSSVTFAKVRSIVVRVRDPIAGKKLVLGGATNPFAPWLSTQSVTTDIRDLFVIDDPTTGWTPDGTNKNLKFAASGAAVTFDVSILGTHV